MNIGYLRKVAPAQNQYRFYSVHVAPDLFGEWSVICEWGRIGQPGCVQIRNYGTEMDALRASSLRIRQKQKRGYWPK